MADDKPEHHDTHADPLWYRAFERFGVTAILLAAVCYGVWCVVAWSAPWLEKIGQSHIRLVDSLGANMDRLAENDAKRTEAITRMVMDYQATHDRTDRRLEEMSRLIERHIGEVNKK